MNSSYAIPRESPQKAINERKYIVMTCCCAMCLLMVGVNSVLTLCINSFILPLLWIAMIKSDYFDASIVPMAFFFNYFGMSFGMVSIVWIYIFIYVYKMLFVKRTKLCLSELVTIFVIGGAQIILPITGIFQEGLKYTAFLVCTVMLFSRHNKISDFEPIYLNIMLYCSASALIPILGFSQVRVVELADGLYRYSAGGIHDPNYSSFLMLLGVLAAISYQTNNVKWKKTVKIVSLSLCLITIVRSVSISGIIGIGILALIFVLLQPGVTRKIKALFAIGAIALFAFFIISTYYPSAISSLLWRIELIINDYFNTDYNRAMSNRLSIGSNYMHSFFDQGIPRILFGLRSMPSTDLVLINGGVTHNSYIDMLFMYGIVGASILIYSLIKKNIRYYISNRIKPCKEYQFIILCSILLLYFSFSLSILPTVQWIVIYFMKKYTDE